MTLGSLPPRSRSARYARPLAAGIGLLVIAQALAPATQAADETAGPSQLPTQTYRVVRSSAVDPAAPLANLGDLAGSLDLSAVGLLLQTSSGPAAPLVAVGAFELSLGEQSFRARTALEYEGLRPIFLHFPGYLYLPESGGPWTLAAGGKIVAVSEDGQEVTFRLVDIELEFAPMTGEPTAYGFAGEISATGAIHEVLRTYRIDRDLHPCPSPFDPPGLILWGDSSIRIPPGSVTLTALQADGAIEVATNEPVPGMPPDTVPPNSVPPSTVPPSTVPPSTVRMEGGSIGLSADEQSQPILVAASSAPAYLALRATTHLVASNAEPSDANSDSDPIAVLIEQLGLEGTDFEVTVSDDAATYRVTTSGDLVVHGGDVAIDGLTHLVLEALGTIELAGSLRLPPGTELTIEADGSVIAGDDVTIIVPPLATATCEGLEFVASSPRVTLAEISFSALALREVSIDVRPGRAVNRVHPFSRGQLPVAILGGPDFDVRDVVVPSLRLGPGASRATHSRASRPFDLDDDGYDDLIVRFPIAGSGVAPGDTELCLSGETATRSFDGCDAIETRRPRRPRLPSRVRWIF